MIIIIFLLLDSTVAFHSKMANKAHQWYNRKSQFTVTVLNRSNVIKNSAKSKLTKIHFWLIIIIAKLEQLLVRRTWEMQFSVKKLPSIFMLYRFLTMLLCLFSTWKTNMRKNYIEDGYAVIIDVGVKNHDFSRNHFSIIVYLSRIRSDTPRKILTIDWRVILYGNFSIDHHSGAPVRAGRTAWNLAFLKS